MHITAHHPNRTLRRSPREGVIAGVAAGLGRYIGIDPVVVRLAFALLVFAGGIGALAYVVAWIVMPSDDESVSLAPDLQRRLPSSRWNWRAIAGGIALGIGAIAFGWIYESHLRAKVERTALIIPDNIDYYLSNFRYRSMNVDGTVDFEFKSPRLEHHLGTDVSNIEVPSLQIFRNTDH